ncbi:hypothetical protein HZA76_01900 [Candidatus Roizmanbacteria bacterium]|nr:hypothetical protein [Candidatus Roizmanbacteria bacterium]
MTENKSVRPYEEFAAHIFEETVKAREQLQTWIDDPTITSVGCVDKLTQKGSANPPGGLIFLNRERVQNTNENALMRFVRVRAEAGVLDGTLMAHENCGYMRVVLGSDYLSEHQGEIFLAKRQLDTLNKMYGTRFRVEVEKIGSAAPYMKK